MAASIFLLLLAAHATDTWSDPHPGVRHLHRTTSTPEQIFALQVDLCAAGVSARATQEDERQRTVSSFAGLVGAQAAINGDFFSYDGYWPCGLAVGGGETWHADNSTFGFVALGPDGALVTEPTTTYASPEAWMTEAVGGYPLLVRDGAALSSFSPAPDHCSSRNPRTAVGLTEDRRTLWLVVVDGRSDASAGMTCAELSALMDDLGAHTALNLDGGGSSAIWTAAGGVLNDPSDGSQRVVSNHLAIFASGAGAPGACDLWLDETVLQAHLFDDGGTTDVDGDGLADACARGAAGLSCWRSTGGAFPAHWDLADLSDANGYSEESHQAGIRWGDLDGDGNADLCARGADGVQCWKGSYQGFSAVIAGPQLTDGVGWGALRYATTLRLADFTGDGRDDLCARAAAGFRCYPSNGDGFDDPIELGDLSDAQGWTQPWYWGTIRMGDLDGDGRADVCARGAAGVVCWLSDGAGFPTQIGGPSWSDAAGFTALKYWSTIRMADVDGDGRADLCARTAAGFECYLSTGDGFSAAVVGPELSDASGWGDYGNYATLRLGDLDGDGDLDLVARANAGIRWWAWDGGAFQPSVAGPELSDAAGWEDHRYATTLRLADIDGDGKADLCARGPAGLSCWLGPDLATEIAGPALSDASGWSADAYYPTIRLASRPRSPAGDTGGDSDPGPHDSPGPDSGEKGGPDLAPRFPAEGCYGCAGAPMTVSPWLALTALALVSRTRRRRRAPGWPCPPHPSRARPGRTARAGSCSPR